jgi:hypothetical protein
MLGVLGGAEPDADELGQQIKAGIQLDQMQEIARQAGLDRA